MITFTSRLNDSGSATRQPPLRRLTSRIARGVASALRRHFLDRDAQASIEHGAGHTGFWRKVADSLSIQSQSDSVTRVTVDHPHLNHKVKGGWIQAIRSRFLTIPLIASARGKSAREFEREHSVRLFFARSFSQGSQFLARRLNQGGLQPVYLLKPSVFQPADDEALPPLEVLETAGLNRSPANENHDAN